MPFCMSCGEKDAKLNDLKRLAQQIQQVANRPESLHEGQSSSLHIITEEPAFSPPMVDEEPPNFDKDGERQKFFYMCGQHIVNI